MIQRTVAASQRLSSLSTPSFQFCLCSPWPASRECRLSAVSYADHARLALFEYYVSVQARPTSPLKSPSLHLSHRTRHASSVQILHETLQFVFVLFPVLLLDAVQVYLFQFHKNSLVVQVILRICTKSVWFLFQTQSTFPPILAQVLQLSICTYPLEAGCVKIGSFRS